MVLENMFGLPTRQKVTIMVAVMVSLLLAALDQTIVGTAMPRIIADLNGLEHFSWVITAYMLTSTITVPISGKLSDLFGRRPMLIGGIAIFVGASMLSGMSTSMWMLIGFRALQGVGAGILMSNTFATVGDLFPPAERAKWQGMIAGVFGLSSVIGPLLGGWLTDNASWRWTFYVNVPVGILALLLLVAFMPNVKHSLSKAIDFSGAFLLSAGLGSLILALSWGGHDYAWNSVQIVGLFITSAVSLILFLLNEYYVAKDPILPLDLFKNRTFDLSMVIMFFFGMAMMGTMMYIPMFAQFVLGSSATNSGVIMLPMVAGMMVTAIGSGQLVSRTGRYKVLAIIGMFGTTAAIWWMSTLTASSTNGDLALRMVAAGLFMGITMPIFNLIVQNAFPQNRLGVVTASIQLFRSLGMTVGVAVMGSIMTNDLTSKLSGLKSDPFAANLSKFSHGAFSLDKVDINVFQRLLSPESLAKIHQGVMAQLAQLPAAARAAAETQVNAGLDNFVHLSRVAISESVSHLFLISASVIVIACAAVLFIHEVPLRKGHESAGELAAAEIAVEYGDFAAEDESQAQS
jgi:EmrB/QacA subfamily drug resistance transporter